MIDLAIKDLRGNIIIHKLGAGKHTLGKSLTSDVVLMDKYTSRHHADIIVTDKKIVLIDFNSTNGIWINKSRAGKKTMLESGSTFIIGSLVLSVNDSIFNYAVRQGHPYSIEELEGPKKSTERADILDFGKHRKYKEKTG